MRLYHNPRCSKSRQAVALLEEKGVEFETYLYLKQGIDSVDMSVLINLEGIIRVNDLDQKADLDNPQTNFDGSQSCKEIARRKSEITSETNFDFKCFYFSPSVRQ